MTAIEIVLIIIGFACLCLSYFVAGKSGEAEAEEGVSAAIWTEKEEEMIRDRVTALVEENQMELVEQTEDQMSRLCNEKIMAMDEFSRQILEKIDSNHQEVVFMYNLLNEKEKEMKRIMAEPIPVRMDPAEADPVPVSRPKEAVSGKMAVAGKKTAPAREREAAGAVEPSLSQSASLNASSLNKTMALENTPALNNTSALEKTIASSRTASSSGESRASSAQQVKSSQAETLKKRNQTSLQGNQTSSQVKPSSSQVKPSSSQVRPLSSQATSSSTSNAKSVSPNAMSQAESQDIRVPGNVNLQIQKMYKEGKSVLEISKALDIGQGEVKLVIALYGGKGR